MQGGGETAGQAIISPFNICAGRAAGTTLVNMPLDTKIV